VTTRNTIEVFSYVSEQQSKGSVCGNKWENLLKHWARNISRICAYARVKQSYVICVQSIQNCIDVLFTLCTFQLLLSTLKLVANLYE
jgi:hypothetical protein